MTVAKANTGVERALAYVDTVKVRQCSICHWPEGKAALSALISAMEARGRRLTGTAVADFIEAETGQAFSRTSLANHLVRHEPRWAKLRETL